MKDDPLNIPKRAVFKAAEVCEIVHVQPYVLRTWEAEFPDLGTAKTSGGSRYYRRSDVERVLRIKQLLFGEGLTLAGVRRRLSEERRPKEDETPPLEELLGRDARERLTRVRDGLKSIQRLLSGDGKRENAAVPELARPVEASSTRGGARSSSGRAGRREKGQPKRKRASA